MLIMTFMGATCMTKAGAQACLSLCYICSCELKRLFSIAQLLNGTGHPLSHLLYFCVTLFMSLGNTSKLQAGQFNF